MKYIFLVVILSFLISGCGERYNASVNEFFNEIEWFTPKGQRRRIIPNSPTADMKIVENPYGVSETKPGFDGYQGKITRSNDGGYEEDSYGAGFEAGCATMSSAIGTGSLRLRKEVIDGDRLTNDESYQRGYQDAASICTFHLDWETH